MASGLWSVLFPMYVLEDAEESEDIRQQLLSIFAVLDRLHVQRDDAEPVKVPEPILFACLLLPWARHRYKLPEVNVRGQGFHRLSRMIRDEIEQVFGEPFNVQRMAKEMVTTLLINLSTFHHARSQGGDPKWLKKKSYYRDCSRFFDIHLESQGVSAVKAERFVVEEKASEPVTVTPPVQPESNGASKARGRGGMNPAFSQAQDGVFGLRRAKH